MPNHAIPPAAWRHAALFLDGKRNYLTPFEQRRLVFALAVDTPTPYIVWWLYSRVAKVAAVEADAAGHVWHAWRTGEQLVAADDGWRSWFTTDSGSRLPVSVILP